MAETWRLGPSHVDFNVTNGCNLACIHCHSSSGAKLPQELTTSEILRVLDELHDMGVMRVAIAGGEPFIRRDILDVLEYACQLDGWQVAVITNGLFFKRPAAVAALASRCPELTVNVSLDGSTPQRFHVLRRQARRADDDPTAMFDQIIAGIRALVAAGITTAVNVTLSRPTIHDSVSTYRLAVDELGAAALVGIKFFPGGYGRAYRDALELPYHEWSEAFAKLTRLKLAGELARMQISVPAAWEFYLPLLQAGIDVHAAERAWGYRAALREEAYRAARSVGDPAGFAELSIAGDGTVYPSVLFVGASEVSCGNVRLQSLRDIWATAGTLVHLRALDVDTLAAQCTTCTFRSVCGGGSRARAYAEAHALNAVDYACPLARAGDSPQPRPVPAARPPTAVERARVLGAGPNAARVFITDDGCQIRANGHIVTCAGDEARLVRAVVEADAPGAALSVAQQSGLDQEVVALHLTSLLGTLHRVGVPPTAVESLHRILDLAGSGERQR